jgi:hypothetical protein
MAFTEHGAIMAATILDRSRDRLLALVSAQPATTVGFKVAKCNLEHDQSNQWAKS